MGFSDAVRSIRSIWGHGDDDYDTDRDDLDDAETDNTRDDYKSSQSSGYGSGYSSSYRSSAASGSDSSDYGAMPSESKYSSSAYPTARSSYGSSGASSGLGSSTPAASSTPSTPSTPSAASRMRSAIPTLRAREKNIYTIKPKRLDEATVAADCLKTGSAVIVNLEAVDRVTAVRIVDFMSGVCYGIDGTGGQSGNAMKLGEMIFLFTPAEFEITSDETDYAANQEHFFREMTEGQIASAAAAASALPGSPAGSPAPSNPASGSFASSYNSPVDYAAERRAWER